MRLEELETRLNGALLDLERTLQQQQQTWRQDYQALQQQLAQSQQREHELSARINQLVNQLNMVDASPERNPLMQKIKVINAYVDALAKDASAFARSLP
ncbi:hypothetical protein FJU30_02600 [Affinibrenneria salicis]|uniref:MbeD/MobD like protein n=1 Tax=Affinibrenneria salicis TaxID=2590031 RepID=A0A5J5G6Q2_9GAMM|nr:hypothetical protein [Affinibrenneria salicis]KAA9002821.1 hypothetical protein FJU30_02165 [Affinibrenneria salicis]KAA9002892.1 hypothetical protein FJU30_02600 [Affinibrenneria salicis]